MMDFFQVLEGIIKARKLARFDNSDIQGNEIVSGKDQKLVGDIIG